MATNDTPIEVVFTQGLNQKIDSKSQIGATLTALENRRFNKLGALDKRYGYTSLSTLDTDQVEITNMNALSRYKNELLLFADSNLYTYASGADRWINVGGIVSANAKFESIITNEDEQIYADSVVVNNCAVYVWYTESGGIRGSARDVETGAFWFSNQLLSASGTHPRVAALGNSIFILWTESNNLKAISIPTGSPSEGLPFTLTLTTDTYASTVAGDGTYDIVAVGTRGIIAFKSTTANTISLMSLRSDGIIDSTVDLAVTAIEDVISLYAHTDSKVYLAYKQTTAICKVAILTQALTVSVAAQTFESTEDVVAIALGKESDSSIRLVYQVAGAEARYNWLKTNTISTAGTVGTASTFLRSVGLATRAFYRDQFLVNVLHESEFQATVFTVNASGQVISKFQPGNAGQDIAIWAPSSVSFLDSTNNVVSFAINYKGTIRSENTTLFSLLGIGECQLDFTTPKNYTSAQLNNNLLISGGILSLYDGAVVVEQGFNLFPEDVELVGSGTDGYMSDGTYSYVSTYSWTDNQGVRHQSAPSPPVSVTLSGGTSTQKVTATIPTLHLTQKAGVVIDLYRTEDAGTIYYKVTSILDPQLNNTTVDTIDIIDTLADASIISNEILYTVGGVLDNIAAPSCDVVITHTNRMWLAGLDDKNLLQYSKIVRPGEGVAFNEALNIRVDPIGGDIVQLASMDGNLIVFKRDNIYSIAGDGPSDVGEGATFTEPNLISTDVGCVDANSVVLGPDGIYFKSAKGIYLLTTQLAAEYIGAPVEDYNQYSVTTSQLLDDQNEVRFGCDDGTVLVYNYYFKQWSINPNLNEQDALIWQNSYIYISTDDRIFRETKTSFKDGDAFVSSKITTGWIRLGGLQDYQRAKRLSIIGTWRSSHSLQVRVYNDYSDEVVDERVFTVDDLLSVSSNYYGDGDFSNEDSVYGGSESGVYQFQIHLSRQKCMALRVEITDLFDNRSTDSSSTGEGFSLNGISVLVGRKMGQNKIRKEKRQ